LEQPNETQAPAEPGQLLSAHAVELLFWGGVLVALGYLFYYQPTEGLRIAPHARLGRMLLLVGGAFAYGSLRGTRLAPQGALLLALCILQALMMAVGWLVYAFGANAGRFFAPQVVARARSLALGVDLAAVFALLVLLRKAGRASRMGFFLGAVFFISSAVVCLVAPVLLSDSFWLAVLDWPASEAAERPAGAVQVALVVFSLIVLIKTYRLAHWGGKGAVG